MVNELATITSHPIPSNLAPLIVGGEQVPVQTWSGQRRYRTPVDRQQVLACAPMPNCDGSFAAIL
jgi:hypothetical protein